MWVFEFSFLNFRVIKRPDYSKYSNGPTRIVAPFIPAQNIWNHNGWDNHAPIGKSNFQFKISPLYGNCPNIG